MIGAGRMLAQASRYAGAVTVRGRASQASFITISGRLALVESILALYLKPS